MRKTRKTVTSAMLAALVTIPAAAGAQPAPEADDTGQWVHVRVDEADGGEVALNLPISLIDVALGEAAEEGFDADDLRFGPGSDVDVDDLRRIWRELRDAGDTDFVDVRDGDERVRVYRRGDRVHVDVDEDGRETVRIRMPAHIVDALLSGEGDRLDLPAAVRELARSGEQEVVRIDDRDEGTTVRIWVDRDSSGEGAGSVR